MLVRRAITVRIPVTLTAAAIGLCSLAAVAQASSITYDVVTGPSSMITLFATNANNGNALLGTSGGMLPMTSLSQVTFDSGMGTLPSWDLTDAGSTSLALSGALSGDFLVVTAATVMPESPYTSSVTSTGVNSYNFSAGELDATGTWKLENSGGTVLQSGSFNQMTPSLNGQFATSGNSLQNLTLTGIALGEVTIGTTPVTFTADVEFNGAAPVPVPGAIWLLGSGLAGLAVWWRRRPV